MTIVALRISSSVKISAVSQYLGTAMECRTVRMAAMRKLTAVLRKPANLDSFNAKMDFAYHQAMCVTHRTTAETNQMSHMMSAVSVMSLWENGPFINSLGLTDL